MIIPVYDTGRRVYHPWSCGGCHGAGCPIVSLSPPKPPWTPDPAVFEPVAR